MWHVMYYLFLMVGMIGLWWNQVEKLERMLQVERHTKPTTTTSPQLRKQQHQHRLQKQLQELQLEQLQHHLDNMNTTTATAEQWKQKYLHAKDATPSFQLPTLFTVRDYYNHHHDQSLPSPQPTEGRNATKTASSSSTAVTKKQHRHSHHLDTLPPWIKRYIEFHNQNVYLHNETQLWTLKEGAKFLKYSWCHKQDTSHKIISWGQRLWAALGYSTNQRGSVSTCHGEQDILHAMDGLLTAFYVAMMTKRVLIVQDDHTTPLIGYLDPNLIRWNVQEYPQRPPLLSSHAASTFPIVPATTMVEMQYVQHLCLHYMSIQGLELTTQEWLGESHLWTNSQCMQTYWRWSASQRQPKQKVEQQQKEHDDDDDLVLDTDDSTENNFLPSPTDRRHLYRWGFWSLFQINQVTLDSADRIRTLIGMESSSIGSNDPDSKDEHSNKIIKDLLQPVMFQPYYYGISSNANGDNSLVLQCAQNLFRASLKLASTMKQQLSFDDDYAIEDYAIEDDKIKQAFQAKINKESTNLFERSLVLASSPAAYAPLTDTDNAPNQLLPLSEFPVYHLPSQQQPTAPFKTEQTLRSTNRSFGENNVWYTGNNNIWTELVVAIEAECIIHNSKTNLDGKISGILAQRVSITHPETMKRCTIGSLKDCAISATFNQPQNDKDETPTDKPPHDEATPFSLPQLVSAYAAQRWSQMLADTLPWANEAVFSASGSEDDQVHAEAEEVSKITGKGGTTHFFIDTV